MNYMTFCRFRLHFERESKAELAQRKKQAMQPFQVLSEVGGNESEIYLIGERDLLNKNTSSRKNKAMHYYNVS